jgi:hypothetical protein
MAPSTFDLYASGDRHGLLLLGNTQLEEEVMIRRIAAVVACAFEMVQLELTFYKDTLSSPTTAASTSRPLFDSEFPPLSLWMLGRRPKRVY